MAMVTWVFATVLYVAAINNPQQILKSLKEAERAAKSTPEQTLDNYKKFEADLNTMPTTIELRWHTAAIRAAFRSSKLELAHDVFVAMKPSYDISAGKQKGFYYNLAGIWFRKSGYNKFALKAYQCALATSKNDKEKIKYLNNLGVAARHSQDLNLAKQAFNEALVLLKESSTNPFTASINNNQGMLALSEGNFELARKKFTRAFFLKEGKATTTSQLTTALNLMHTLLLLKNYNALDNLDKKVSSLMLKTQSTDQKVYYLWIQYSMSVLSKKNSDNTSTNLISQYQLVSDSSYKFLIQQRAKSLGIPLPSLKNTVSKGEYKGVLIHYLAGC